MYTDFSKGTYNNSHEQSFIDLLYPSCQNISIDYGVMQSAQNRVVIPADFGWSDIGTWGSLYTHLPKDNAQNASVGAKTVFEDSNNCIVNLPKGNHAIIHGLNGYLVAYHGGNLIVCKIEDEQKIKNWIELL